ncbi:hypothetical protein AB0D33_14065 [Streptomyces sp. NPDC048404]|uniref:hypothetical protein n=1 Tax=unclassified Streptomyces TaxID=2593676 RepID=UPI00342F0CEB
MVHGFLYVVARLVLVPGDDDTLAETQGTTRSRHTVAVLARSVVRAFDRRVRS